MSAKRCAKVRFANKERAKQARSELGRDETNTVYRCPVCRCWHLTRSGVPA